MLVMLLADKVTIAMLILDLRRYLILLTLDDDYFCMLVFNLTCLRQTALLICMILVYAIRDRFKL